jgi:6-phospho-3-hexuloisomerase
LEPALNRAARLDLYVDAVRRAVASVPEAVHRDFVGGILGARQIVVAGRGRSGMVASAFARRLGQMGLSAWGLDDSTVPRLGGGDALVAATGSGTTPTVLSLMQTARSGGAAVLCVTRAPARPEIAEVTDVVCELAVPPGGTVFPLGTLFEAALLAYLDQVVVDLLEALGKTESELFERHTNLE